MPLSAQKFGGPWSVLKVETVAAYLQAYVNALKNQRFTTVYVDAFAGSGSFSFDASADGTLFDEQRATREHEGSAARALQVAPPFDRLFFVELKKKNVKSLEALAEKFKRSKACEIVSGDANEQVKLICSKISKKARTRGVIFLDPFGMELEWETLRAIAETKALDVWYLFPLGGVLRNAPHDIKALSPIMARALDRGLGTKEWRQEFYKPVPVPAQGTLFGGDTAATKIERLINPDVVEAYVKAQLENVFPHVLTPRRLPGHKNSPAFSLFFAMANPDSAAWKVADPIAKHLLKPR